MSANKKRLIAVICLLVGLAPAPARAAGDPLELFNRAMFAFNRAVVDYVVDPLVQNVGPTIPKSTQAGLRNMYSNLTEVEFLLNGLLRADLGAAATSAGRFVVNSTVGLAGVFDIATSMGMKRQTSDFGGSLCQTGLPPGPYLVLPFVGATNLIAAPALAAGVALEVYALSFISTTLAMADFIIIDIGGSASALRYMTSVPAGEDGYAVQRAEYQKYIESHCGGAS
jgi:phospholipid-binding lipoprotein MlaA